MNELTLRKQYLCELYVYVCVYECILCLYLYFYKRKFYQQNTQWRDNTRIQDITDILDDIKRYTYILFKSNERLIFQLSKRSLRMCYVS